LLPGDRVLQRLFTMNTVIPFLLQYGYPVLFLWVLIETIGLPLPSVPLLITMGALAGVGQRNLLLCIGLGGCAALLGDIFWYTIGRRRGRKVLSLLCRISFEPESCVRRTENIFSRYGARSFLITKFIPGLNAIATSMAGIIRLPLSRFFLFDIPGTFFFISAYTLIGYLISEELERALSYGAGISKIILLLVSGGLALYVLGKFISRQRLLKQLAMEHITPEELKRKIDAGEHILIVDVRHPSDIEGDPYVIPGAIRISTVAEQQPAFSGDGEIVAYCTCPNEASSARAALNLRQRGMKRVRPLSGGFDAWRGRGYPVAPAGPKSPGDPGRNGDGR
jgi:membrane protein DedA with SNARE-associated domain